jgi:hypothetical protein
MTPAVLAYTAWVCKVTSGKISPQPFVTTAKPVPRVSFE